MSLDTDWNDIVETDEYQTDLAKLTKLSVRAFGLEEYVDETNPFVFATANLLAIQRYFIRHQAELVDIDITPFLNLIQKEVGLDLPLSPELPILEWLRESKSWFGHRGTLNIYPFIGALVGSPLEIDFPAKLIFRTSHPNSCLSGKITSHGGPVRFNDSQNAKIRDGIVWSQFTYIVKVLQAQLVDNITDLINLLNNVHPAGTKKFIEFDYNYILDTVVGTLVTSGFDSNFSYNLTKPYPTLDNNLILDDRGSQLSMHFGSHKIVQCAIDDIPPFETANCYRQLPYDTLTNIYIGTRTYAGVQRQVYNATTDSYTQLYSDTDALVLANVTTNIGLESYTNTELTGLSGEQLRDCAQNEDQQNMEGQAWMPDLLKADIITS